MPTNRQLDRKISGWLEAEAPRQLPDLVLRATFERTRKTRQQGGWHALLGRLHMNRFAMNKLLPIGLGAAAVVVALVVGTRLLGPPAPGGVGGVPSVQPSVAPSPTAAPSVAKPSTSVVGREPGPYVFTGTGGPAITVTIPAPGWDGDGGILVKNNNTDPPDGAGMIGPWYGPLYVYGDPCRWSTTTPTTPATTVDELVAALTAQKSRAASPPVDITVDGYSGKSITLHVPDEAVFAPCDQGQFGSWQTAAVATDGPERYHQGPGQIDELVILDVSGKLMTFDAAYYKGTPAGTVAELHAILDSMTFKK